MSLKTVPFLAALLVFVPFGRSAAQTRPAPIAGTAVAGVVLRSYEPSKGRWVAHLANVSHKNVVYVNISLDKNSESGSYYAPDDRPITFPHPRTDTRFPMRGGDTFPSDTTKDIFLGADVNESITPVVDVVVYADDTAEVANELAFKRYILPIKEKVLTLEKENEILAQFASSPNRVADTVTELLRVASDLPDPHMRHDEDPHVNSEELLSLARELKQGRVDPETAIKDNAEQIEIETKHAQITRITNDQI